MCSCRLFCLFHCEKALSLMNGAWAHRRIVVYSCFHCVSVCVFQPHACMLLARLWLFYSIFEKVSAILYRTTAAGSNAMHDNIGLNVGFGYPGDTELVTSTHTHTHTHLHNTYTHDWEPIRLDSILFSGSFKNQSSRHLGSCHCWLLQQCRLCHRI